jgi:hypothetical protein
MASGDQPIYLSIFVYVHVRTYVPIATHSVIYPALSMIKLLGGEKVRKDNVYLERGAHSYSYMYMYSYMKKLRKFFPYLGKNTIGLRTVIHMSRSSLIIESSY